MWNWFKKHFELLWKNCLRLLYLKLKKIIIVNLISLVNLVFTLATSPPLGKVVCKIIRAFACFLFWDKTPTRRRDTYYLNFRKVYLFYPCTLKVSLFRKQILKFSFEPKNERKYFSISGLASLMGQIIKITAHYCAN